MAIVAECPVCHKKQSVRNKVCTCGTDLDKEKGKKKRVKYHIIYRVNGRQKWEYVGYSISEARDADGKRKLQKRENRIFEIKPDAKMTFKELSEWYLNLESVKAKKYYPTLSINLNSFNADFGNMVVGQIKPVDLENYQAKRKKEGYSDSYVDQETGAAKTVINKAFMNNLVSGETVKAFRRIKKLLKRNANARDRILSTEEFDALMGYLPRHTKVILAIAFYTGMRKGEILKLTWDKVDLKSRIITLEASDTKDKEARAIPICDELYEILRAEASPIRDADHDNHVVLYQEKPVRDIRSALKTACKKVGIPYGRSKKDGFTFHDLRHTFNTYMRKAGVHDSVIMKITGHSTAEMFNRYNTVDAEDKKHAVSQYEVFLGNVRQTVRQDSRLSK